MLDMARIVSGKLRLDIGTVDPVAVDAGGDRRRRSSGRGKGHQPADLDQSRSPSIRGDADRMQQIIWNILSNAVKFTPTGGVVHVRAEQRDASIVITVEDTGEGIAADFLPLHLRSFPSGDVVREPDPGRTRPRPGAGPAAGRDAGRPGQRRAAPASAWAPSSGLRFPPPFRCRRWPRTIRAMFRRWPISPASGCSSSTMTLMRAT